MASVSWELEGGRHEVPVDGVMRIGREGSVEVCIPDRSVSKEHARLEVREDGVWVVDLGSTNGTYVNRRRVREGRRLEEGDEILVGRRALRFSASRRQQLGTNVRIQSLPEGTGTQVVQAVSREEHRFPPHDQLGSRRELEREYRRLRIAFEVQSAVLGETDLERVFERILEAALSLFEADRAVVVLVEPGGELRSLACRTRGPSVDEVVVSQTVLQRVLTEGAAVLSVDARTDTRFQESQSLVAAGVRATMAVPIADEAGVMGVIYLDSTMSAGAFADQDISLLAEFARAATRAIGQQRAQAARERESTLRGQLSRLMPEALVAEIMRGELSLERKGRECEATVLFADIRGFTAMAEAMSPAEVVALLNAYFDVMVDVVFRHGGVLDKFIGDALMAVWGGLGESCDHAAGAVAAALEMREAVADLNAIRRVLGQPGVEAGIGIATGELVAGYMGSARSMSYTVIGDVVNTAARVCGEAEGGQVVVTARVAAATAGQVAWEAMAPLKVKGKRHPLEVAKAPERVED